MGTVWSSSASSAVRIAPGGASNRFTVQVADITEGALAITRSLLDGVAQAPELVGFAEHPAPVTFLLMGLVRVHV